MWRIWTAAFIGTMVLIVMVPLVLVQGWTGHQKKEAHTIYIHDYREKKVRAMDLEEYIKGVVAAELGPNAPLEARKAQAIAARTYALYSEEPVSTDPAQGQAYLSREDVKERWGSILLYREWARITKAVEETRGVFMAYGGEPALTVYHANSGGMTEDSGLVWGESLPYLQSLPSPFDGKDERWREDYRFTQEEVARHLWISVDEAQPWEIREVSDSGRILSLEVGPHLFCGRELRQALNLPSTLLEWEWRGSVLHLTTYGRGHGVGMSQDGAVYLAEQGYSCYQILRYYYPGISFKTW